MLPAGVTGNRGLSLNAGQVAFLRALRAAVPGVPLHVTSATRTPERQAATLVTKRKLGEDLRRLYRSNGDIAAALMAAPNTTSAMAAIIRRYMNAGRYLSRHMRGDAVDLRTRNLSGAQRQQVLSAAGRLGARAVYETTPAHIHIERIGGNLSDAKLALLDAGGQVYRRRRTIAVLSATSAVVGLLLIALLVRRQRST
mgnify:FL=1